MKTPKIAIYTMAKNEIDNVNDYVETTREADLVVVTDTGSTDGTDKELSNQGIVVKYANIQPWRFDIATNCALCHVPEDIDICIKLDLDERIYQIPGERHWRDELTEYWNEGCRQFNYWYTWSWKEDSPDLQFMASHIHGRNGYFWQHPGHAALRSSIKAPAADLYSLQIHHYMRPKSRPNYIGLLELGVKENKCSRTLFYLGREYYFNNRFDDAINTFTEYLHYPDTHWRGQKAIVMIMMGKMYEAKNEIHTAQQWFLKATAEKPMAREVWWELFYFYYRIEELIKATAIGTICLNMVERSRDMIYTNEAWTEKPKELYNDCQNQLAVLGCNL